MSASPDALVIGGGLLGSAAGYGLARRGLKVMILDEGDDALRAARGNFGLVWVQSKGIGCPAYADWTARSAELWPEFAAELHELTGTDTALEQNGGVILCLGDDEYEEVDAQMAQLDAQQEGRFRCRMLDHNALKDLLPGIGPEVTGGSWSEHDGHCDPLKLMLAMQTGIIRHGGRILAGQRVTSIARDGMDVRVETADATYRAERILLAAGLGNAALAGMVGLDQPVFPLKGQILVTARLPRMLDIPTSPIRQTGDGTVMIGTSHEDAGLDISSKPTVMRDIADRARRSFPALAQARIVRSWAALRVMTPDGHPVYGQSEEMPGVFAMSCHSGVTLAAAHAMDFAGYIADGALGERVEALQAGRFDVPPD